MILESIVTTRNEDGSTNVSPMGPTVSDIVPQSHSNSHSDSHSKGGPDLSHFELRPFNTSTTYANLKRTREGIMHVTDDVLLFAKAAVGAITELPNSVRGTEVNVDAIADACRWYEFTVDYIDETGPRISLNCKTVHQHRERDFFGFNRAKHAVLEAAILATRLDFLPAAEIADQFERLGILVTKTGGEAERKAFEILSSHVAT